MYQVSGPASPVTSMWLMTRDSSPSPPYASADSAAFRATPMLSFPLAAARAAAVLSDNSARRAS
jgi:hypothetical protein